MSVVEVVSRRVDVLLGPGRPVLRVEAEHGADGAECVRVRVCWPNGDAIGAPVVWPAERSPDVLSAIQAVL